VHEKGRKEDVAPPKMPSKVWCGGGGREGEERAELAPDLAVSRVSTTEEGKGGGR